MLPPGETLTPSPRHLPSLESLRGVAALMIVFYHLSELLKLPLPGGLSFIKTHFGMGVPLFYVLSGFVLSYGYAEKLDCREKILHFYARRFFRIAPLFYFMLIIWCLTSYAGWNKVFSSQTIFFNVFFLFGLVPGYHESIVWAGWSVGVEMFFYLLFPVVICLFAGVRSATIGFLISLVVSTAIYHAFEALEAGSYAYMNLGTHLPFFLAGVLSFRIWEKSGFALNPLLGRILLVVGLALSAVLVTWQPAPIFLAQLRFGALDRNIWALIFASILLAACFSRFSLLEKGKLLRVGNWSYSVYILHPFLMLLLIKADVAGRLMLHISNEYILFFLVSALTLTLVLLASTATYRWIERPGMALGKKLTLLMQVKNPTY